MILTHKETMSQHIPTTYANKIIPTIQKRLTINYQLLYLINDDDFKTETFGRRDQEIN